MYRKILEVAIPTILVLGLIIGYQYYTNKIEKLESSLKVCKQNLESIETASDFQDVVQDILLQDVNVSVEEIKPLPVSKQTTEPEEKTFTIIY